jgi:glycosyltransferase involved in cell wall biosynthesis
MIIRNKLIFTFHNDVPHHYKRKQYFPYKVITKLASKLIFVSQSTMNRFINNYGTPSSYQLIQHGIMPIDMLAESSETASPVVENVLLFWGKVEAYKGVDIFCNMDTHIPVEILGKWSPQLNSLKRSLADNSNITIADRYLSIDELSHLLSRSGVFILPYKNATQSGVLYTLLSYGKVFICSDVGENKKFLIKHGLKELIFNREDRDSIRDAVNFAFEHYDEIHRRMLAIREEYRWQHILSAEVVDVLYNTSS